MIDELKRHVVARPFKPFRVVLRDGLRLDVTRVAQLAIGRTRFTFADDEAGRTRDFLIEQVASLQMLDAQEHVGSKPLAPFDVTPGGRSSCEGSMIDELKQHVIARPFKPFRVILRDGTKLDVTRIAQLAIGRTLFMYAPPATGQILEFKVDQIASLNTVENASAA